MVIDQFVASGTEYHKVFRVVNVGRALFLVPSRTLRLKRHDVGNFGENTGGQRDMMR
jgi:hypothetical protein